VAFDVYAGSLTRFYRRDWENVAQRMAREQGLPYTMIYAGGEPEEPPPAEEVRQAVAQWCDALSQALQPHSCGPVKWDEGDHVPYFTDRPGWGAYASLLVFAAHLEHPDVPMPTEIPRAWADDIAYQRSTDREFKSPYRTILEAEVWLPTEFPFVFDGPTLVSEKSCIGSVFSLKRQLDDLHQQSAQLQELKQTPKVQAPPAKNSSFLGDLFSRKPPQSKLADPAFADAAEFGLSVFRDLATKACEHRLPMLLHY
jgi:hypothetical protein